jgi:hypothetical protein
LLPHSRSDTLGPFKAIRGSEQGLPTMKLSEHVRSTHSQDGAVVLDIPHGQMFRLNFVGSRIVELLKDGYSREQIADQISGEFGKERNIVEIDLGEFLMHLERHHLLQPVSRLP